MKRVKCTDTTEDLCGLTYGKVYEVEREDVDYYYLACDDDGDSGESACHWKGRFETAEEPAQPSEASRLTARIEAANQMAANIPEKTLWDEYAMAALTGILSREGLGLSPEKKVAAVVEYADLMMEARKDK